MVALRRPELTDVVARSVALVILVSTIFVEVIFTTVRVPATFKFPDKLILPPVIVVAESRIDDTVPNEPTVENNVLVDIFVANTFVIVLLEPLILAVLTLVDPDNVPAFTLTATTLSVFIFTEVKLVILALLDVIFVATKFVVVIFDNEKYVNSLDVVL